MSTSILVVEPDPSVRSMMAVVLASAGHPVVAVSSVAEATAQLDQRKIRLAIVDEAAGGGGVLEEVKLLRQFYPTLPVIVTGTLLSQRVLLVLLRLGIQGALPKPFGPGDLRETVERISAHLSPDQAESLEYAAAMMMAREALGAGRLADAAAALKRASAAALLDSDAMALAALWAELSGNDEDAARGYSAALALRHDEDAPEPGPYAGLARLQAYGGARPVASLSACFVGAPLRVAPDTPDTPDTRDTPDTPDTPDTHDTPGQPASPDIEGGREGGRAVVLMSLGLNVEASSVVYFREGTGPLAFALVAGALAPGARADLSGARWPPGGSPTLAAQAGGPGPRRDPP